MKRISSFICWSAAMMLLAGCSDRIGGKFVFHQSYDAQGRLVIEAETTKNYGRIDVGIKQNEDGLIEASLKAENVDGASLAAEVAKTQAAALGTLGGALNAAMTLASPEK